MDCKVIAIWSTGEKTAYETTKEHADIVMTRLKMAFGLQIAYMYIQ